MAKLFDLQEKRNKLAAQIREKAAAFNAAGQKWKDADERSAWETVNADYASNKKELEDELNADSVNKRLAEVEEEMRSRPDQHPIPGQEDTRNRRPIGNNPEKMNEHRDWAVRGWMAAQMGGQVHPEIQKRMDESMQVMGIRPWQRSLDINMADASAANELARAWRSGSTHSAMERAEAAWERRAMSSSLFASGGGLVFPTLMKRIEINMLAFGGMRQAATTITTDTGEETGMPTADDTSNEGGQIGENQSIGTEVLPMIGQRKWGAWTFTSKPVLVPYSLLQDSQFDVGSMIGDMQGERLGRRTNRAYTNGDGVTGPRGIITASTSSVSSAGSGAIAYGDIVKLEHSVDPAYRAGAGYMCHDTTLLAIRLLLDNQNRPLWTSGTDTNSYDRLNGKPLTNNQNMDAGTTTGNKSLLFGQLNKYFIRRAGKARFYRLEERYRDTDQDGFVTLFREDGNLLDAGTPPVKYLLQS